MLYLIDTISKINDIKNCQELTLNYPLWNTIYIPRSYAQMAYLKEYGIIVRLTCEETNPLARYTNHNDPVFRDSALEFFYKPFTDNPNYVNFEINSIGAVLTQIGCGRSDRVNINPFSTSSCMVATEVTEEKWSVTLQISYDFIEKMYPSFHSGIKMDTFDFNFYKISESEENTHFVSFTSINSPIPNFHLPEFFGKAKIQP